MADQPTMCVTCQTELPVGAKIGYFNQEPFCPTKDDLSFCNEIRAMLEQIKALFDAIGYGENDNFDTATNPALGRLGVEVASEALRRLALYREAVDTLERRYDALEKASNGKEA